MPYGFDSFFCFVCVLTSTIADLFIDFVTKCPHAVVIKIAGELL